MKKILLAGLTVVLLLGAGIVQAKNYTITMHAGNVGGLYMEPAVIWAEQIQAAMPYVKMSCIAGGGSTNPIIVAKGKANETAGMTDPVTAMDVVKGEGEYAKRLPGGSKALRALWRFNVQSWLHVVARPDAIPEGVTTLGELLAKKPKLRILLKSRGSGDEMLAARIFKEYGLSYDDLRKMGTSITFNNPSDMSSMLIDGHADISISTARVPASYLLDMDSSISGLKWLELDKNIIEKLRDQFGYIAGVQPKGSYSSVLRDIPSVANDHIVIVHEDMDEELVYSLVKSVMSEPNKVHSIPALKTFSANAAGLETGLPLHKGAIRAYKELGLPYSEN